MSVKIGVIIGSIRDGRQGETVAKWFLNEANKIKASDVTLELVDLKSFDLPLIGLNPSETQLNDLKRWQETMSNLDGYVLVTPEYNHIVPGSLANAFQLLKPEVVNKALAFVGYGFLGAARAIVGFRAELAYQQIALVQQQLNISFNVDYKDFGTPNQEFTPGAYHLVEIETLMNQLTNWTKALKLVREHKI